jgi:rare lipoprotein A
MIFSKLIFTICLMMLLPLSIAQAAQSQKGIASYYANKFHGRKTANGDIYNKRKLTAAHNGLPLGTKVRVTNLRNKRSIVVKINDRGSFRRRLIDLSYAGAKKLGFIHQGLAKVRVTVIR